MSDTSIDQSVFAKLQDAMGADFVEELVTTFLDEAPGMLAEISTAVETGNKDKFRRAAHSLKSNADIFGARDLADLARQMEVSEFDPNSDQNSAQIAQLSAAYKRAATCLKDLKDG